MTEPTPQQILQRIIWQRQTTWVLSLMKPTHGK